MTQLLRDRLHLLWKAVVVDDRCLDFWNIHDGVLLLMLAMARCLVG